MNHKALLGTARKAFHEDVERRKPKLVKFEEKYGVKIRCHASLEHVLNWIVWDE
jgi:hypothetical protein